MNHNFALASILCSKHPYSAACCAEAIRELCMRDHHGYKGFYASELPGLSDRSRASVLMRQLHMAGLIRKTGNTRPVLVELECYNGWNREVYKVITVQSAEWLINFDAIKALALLDALDLDM